MRGSDVVDIIKTSVPTRWARIYVGLTVRATGEMVAVDVVLRICREYCDRVHLCVTLAPTKYIYVDGSESGVVIGLINYPRFPKSQRVITRQALALAEELLMGCRQCRVSVETPSRTYMLSDSRRILESE